MASDLHECMVCRDIYQDPKILPCAHVVCKKCVLLWLEVTKGHAGCPLCRAPILSRSTLTSQRDLATRVDTLPSDPTTMALMEAERILRNPHVCIVCGDDFVATSYCFQCDVKLCQFCTTYHCKLPHTRDNALEQLEKLTAQRLAVGRVKRCKDHCDRPAEMYCPTHQASMCSQCAADDHGGCDELKNMEEMGKKMRAELAEQAQKLRDAESMLSQQINQRKEKFGAMRSEVKDTFDGLVQAVEQRRDQLDAQIEKAERVSVTSLGEIEKRRTALKSNSTKVDQLTETSADDAIMELMKTLFPRLEDLVRQVATDKMADDVSFAFESKALGLLRVAIRNFGRIIDGKSVSSSHQHTSCPTCGQTTQSVPETMPESADRPKGTELARVLQVGDRVRRSEDWMSFNVDGTPAGSGTVVRAAHEGLKGLVRVRWDAGAEHEHRMGLALQGSPRYELQLE